MNETGLMRVMVTGGGGFVGRHVVRALLDEGHQVSFLARSRYPEVEALGATGLQVDLCDPEALTDALADIDAVLHVAAHTDAWGEKEDFFRINVGGTRHVIEACRTRGIGRLVYTSTPSVVGYERDIENGGQDLPYAQRHLFHYPASKAEAEQLVLAANGPELATVALRPHLVFGAGDNHTLPGLVSRASANALIQVGPGDNRVDLTYIDNAAGAHVDALRALGGPEAACAGRPYFISNAEPVRLWDWIGVVLAALDLPGPRARVGLPTAMALGGAMEWVWRSFGLSGQPRVTRMIAAGLARSHWYDMEPARRDLGYQVRVDMATGTERTIQWLADNLEEILAAHS